jgi:hypothetical protein
LALDQTYFVLPADMMKDKVYPRHLDKDLVIWCDEFVFMRVANSMRITSIPREEAEKLLAPRWDEFVHKGVVELAAEQPGDSAPTCAKKRGRRKAKQPGAAGHEGGVSRAECLPPPSGPIDAGGSSSAASGTDARVSGGSRMRENGGGDGGCSGGGASATGQTVAVSDPEIRTISRRITGQRVAWTWLVDSGASEDIASARDTIKSRILTKALEHPFPFEGVSGFMYVCR